MSKESEKKILSSTPSISSQKRPGGSLETSVESSSGSDRSHSNLHSSNDTSFCKYKNLQNLTKAI